MLKLVLSRVAVWLAAAFVFTVLYYGLMNAAAVYALHQTVF